jgi:hypothetical protein
MAAKTPPDVTPELTQEICKSLSTGMLRPDAAELAGVDRQTFFQWMRLAEEGKEPFASMRAELLKAELTAQRRLLSGLSMAASTNPKFATWLLTHRWRKSWDQGISDESPSVTASGPQLDLKAMAARISGRFPLLPWEDGDEFDVLVAGLLTEYEPLGPTEEHLVEELAGVLQRKGRLRLAENASHRSALKGAKASYSDTREVAVAHLSDKKPGEKILIALTATEEETAADLAEFEGGKSQAEKTIAILESKRANPYGAALTALGDLKEWWDETLERPVPQKGHEDEVEPTYEANPEGLLSYLKNEALPWCEKQIFTLESRPLIRQQALGEAFNRKEVEEFSRIEASLDRKMEKILDRLLQLQQARRAKTG